MTAAIDPSDTPITGTAAGLAYEDHGTGPALILLHGLTFDRTTWRPVTERLGGDLRVIAVDLPAHGESGGEPCSLDALADRVRRLADELGVDRPVVVGHSMSGALALVYVGRHPARGAVSVDQGVDVRGFATLVRRLEPALRGDDFATAFEPFQRSMGFDRLPEPTRSLVRNAQRVRQGVVLGYWDEVLRTEPEEMQARIDADLDRLDVPVLAVFGRALTDAERERYARMADVEVEEWAGEGHFVHLVDPARFTARLRAFVARCVGS